MTDFIYDIETYPNIFTMGALNVETNDKTLFEISWRKHELKPLINFLSWLRSENHRMVGFNNIGFDYPVIHLAIEDHSVTALELYFKAKSIIDSKDKFEHLIWDNQRHVKQVDLYKIHHFDNAAKRTPLKVLEFNMRMDSVQDLPFEPGKLLKNDECDTLISYMWHDIEATYQFYNESMKQIRFREELTEKYGRNFLDSSDVKIGTDIFIMELEKRLPNFNKKVNTPRGPFPVKDVILPWIKFEHPEFRKIHEWFLQQTITKTKGAFKNVQCTIDGTIYKFGTGGIHASVESCTVKADDVFDIIDVDVKSYYPHVSITQKIYPEHLGPVFCDIYKDIYDLREKYPKAEYPTENLMYKYSLNGSYGNINSEYSPLFDPKAAMGITINGQLILCVLAEQMIKIPGVKILQLNTDGIAVLCPKSLVYFLKKTATDWQKTTGMILEFSNFQQMFIRDVNSYIAVSKNGDIKSKGPYNPKPEHHKDHSALVVPKAVEAHLLHGADVRQFIENHEDIYDFMLRTKVPRSSSLVWVDYDGTECKEQNITRYFVSIMGGDLVKIMPPLKGKTKPRRIGIHTGWKTTVANDISDCNTDDVEYEWYIKEAYKLIRPLKS